MCTSCKLRIRAIRIEDNYDEDISSVSLPNQINGNDSEAKVKYHHDNCVLFYFSSLYLAFTS